MGHSHVCLCVCWVDFRFAWRGFWIRANWFLSLFCLILSEGPWRHSEWASTTAISTQTAFVAPYIVVWTLFHVSDWIPTEFLLQNSSYPNFIVIFLSIFNKDITVMSLLLSPHQIRLVNMFFVYFMWYLTKTSLWEVRVSVCLFLT